MPLNHRKRPCIATHNVTSRETSVNQEILSGDVGRLVARQEDDRAGLFNCLSETAHRKVGQSTVKLFGRVKEVHEERCLKRAAEGGEMSVLDDFQVLP